jgi:hypothetical protein
MSDYPPMPLTALFADVLYIMNSEITHNGELKHVEISLWLQ